MHVVKMSIRLNRQVLQLWAQTRKELLQLKFCNLNHNISVSPKHRNWNELSPQYIHHHHHHTSVMELGHLLTRSGLNYPEVSSKVCHDSFCRLGNSVSLPWVIYYGAFYLHVVSSFSCIPVICLKLVLFLIPLQFVHLFCTSNMVQ